MPELIEIGSGSFFADGIYLGGPHIQQGRVTQARTVLGSHTFLGNHAVVPAGQRERLERVCRYVLRPPVAQERLSLTGTGQVVLQLRHRWRDGEPEAHACRRCSTGRR